MEVPTVDAAPSGRPPTPREPGALERRVVGALVKGAFLRGRRGGPWPIPDEQQAEGIRLRGNSGARLRGYYVPAAGDGPTGVVVLAHPDRRYASHWFVRTGWTAWLRNAGFACVAVDFAGYGASRGGSTYFHDDVRAALAEARRRHPGLPVHVIGLSLGSFAAINAAAVEDVDALVLESPYPTFSDWYDHDHSSPRWLARLNATMAKLWPATARRIDAGANIAATRARRILVAASDSDQVTPLALSQTVARAAPVGRTTALTLRGRAHLDLFPDAEYQKAILATLHGPDGPNPAPDAAAVRLISDLV